MENVKSLTPASLLIKLSLLFCLLLASIFVSLQIGSVNLSFTEIFSSNEIIIKIRLPRILLAVSVGGGLSVAGAVFQAILMNPLAEPYILGVSSGGTFGAILSLLLGLSFFGTQALAFMGSFAVIILVFILAKRFGILEPNVLLLTGVMVGAFFSAAILLMITLLDESLRTAIFWLIGNLSLADLSSVNFILPLTIVISAALALMGQKFNVMALGDEGSKNLGINIKMMRNISYILASLLVSLAVSVSGIIGFVGLLIPHACRLIFGTDNRVIIPASFFCGAAFLTIADTFARVIISPAELPVGAVTALIGAPVFIFLLKNRVTVMGK
ncbi:MAG: iron ABC transporter permease [Bacteroidota bacterium]